MKTKTLMCGIILLTALALPASAALTVQSFSCNSQSGTIVVEAGGKLNCEASIKNTGSSTATVSSVSLLTDGTWAESGSYTGVGFSSSLAAGAGTTATFGNIVPTTPGLHTFNYLKLGSVTDSYPASTTVNVVSIKNIVINAPANASQGDEITVSSSVTSGGNMEITLTITPSNCTLTAGETASRNLGVVSDNTVKSASWKLIVGSGTCSYTVRAQGSNGAVSISKTKTSILGGGGITSTQTPLIVGWNLISLPLSA
jgi:hypothetical protein